MRRKLYRLIRKVLKVPDSEMLPEKYDWIPKILFPIEYRAIHNSPIRYDWATRIFYIFGMRYTQEIFEAWSNDGFMLGTKFRLLKREDGVITIEKVLED